MIERGLGLLGMRERARLINAEFQMESKAGNGTSIFVRVDKPDEVARS